MAKNIADFFGEKKQNKAKCKNILDYDFVNDIASNISPEKLSDDEKIEQRPNSSSNKKSQFIRKYGLSFKFIMPFVTSYLCEQGFSSMLYVKNKYTSQLKDLDNRLRLKLTNIEPDFMKLCSLIQSHPSH